MIRTDRQLAMPPRLSVLAMAALAALACGGAAAQDAPAVADKPANAPADAPMLERIVVPGKRAYEVGPLPGLAVTKDQIPANVQSATKEQIKQSRALNIGDYMNTQLQGVSINDYSGNPFQMDVNYRGFTASPQVGTPQGLSVFFDGVRVNEPFGDVVNWDLIPVNAIDRFDLFPGSNPLFGLNTLGGAISVRSKSGFTAPGVEASVTAGSWKRRQLQLSGGGNDGEFAGFGAMTLFKEDGWRDNSPSRVGQFYGRGDWSLDKATITASVLGATNDLVGNGLIPLELYEKRPETVFTSPDQTKNKLLQFTLSGAFEVSDTMNITSRAYRRKSERTGYNGDVYEDFEDLTGRRDVVVDWRRINPTLPICQFAQSDPNTALNGPPGVGCGFVTYEPSPDLGSRRNGAASAGNPQQPGVVDGGTPIGLINKTRLEQVSDGIGAQFNWNLEQHKAMVGISTDRSSADYLQKQRLGTIDASHQVLENPDEIAPQFGAAFADVTGNQFDGKQRTDSVYASDVWSPRNDLHFSLAGRYNRTKTQSNIGARVRAFGGLDEIQASLPNRIVCPSSDPSTCPAEPQVQFDAAQTQLPAVQESFKYSSFNPALGFNWLPNPDLNVYGNVSRGARVPSVVELGCALDLTPALVDPNNPEFGTAPSSSVGTACTLPTTLSGDPFLPQIRSTSLELGLRGRLASTWEWNASIFQTDLKDDIYFVGSGSSRSYFDTIDKTRRRGLEMGIKGRSGQFDLSANYSYVKATFESSFYVLSPRNSSADFDQNSRSFAGDVEFFDEGRPALLPSATAGLNRGLGTFRNILVEPGARLPGIPAHNFNSTIGWRPVEPLRFGLTMIARSPSFVRGNENNEHRAGGTDQQIGQYFCGAGGTTCGGSGYEQATVPVGRPFQRDGRIPGFAIFNLDTSWRATKEVEVSLLVTNLFDRQYYTAGRLGVNPFTPSRVGAIGASGWNYNSTEWQNTNFVGPGAPRGFFLSASYALDL